MRQPVFAPFHHRLPGRKYGSGCGKYKAAAGRHSRLFFALPFYAFLFVLLWYKILPFLFPANYLAGLARFNMYLFSRVSYALAFVMVRHTQSTEDRKSVV